MTSTPPIGAFGLSRIGGLLGMAVAAGQAFTFDGSRYTHAFLVVDHSYVIEAMPAGARFAPLSERIGDPDVRWCDTPVQLAVQTFRQRLADPLDALYDPDPWTAVPRIDQFERNLRAAVCAEAHGLIGARYGFSDYLALTLAHLRIRAPWLRAYINRSGRLICSQLVDEAYKRTGIQLFDDGRLPMDVTPGDLDLYRVTALEAARA